jgi:hypothetical protein
LYGFSSSSELINEIDAVRIPVAVGLKVTVNVVVPPGATDDAGELW